MASSPAGTRAGGVLDLALPASLMSPPPIAPQGRRPIALSVFPGGLKLSIRPGEGEGKPKGSRAGTPPEDILEEPPTGGGRVLFATDRAPWAAPDISKSQRALGAAHAITMEAHPGFWLQRLIDRSGSGDEALAIVERVSALSTAATEDGVAPHAIARAAFEASLYMMPAGGDAHFEGRLADLTWCREKVASLSDTNRMQRRILSLWVFSYRNATELDLKGLRLSDEHFSALWPMLLEMPRLLVLHLQHNDLSAETLPEFAELAFHHPALVRLSMVGNRDLSLNNREAAGAMLAIQRELGDRQGAMGYAGFQVDQMEREHAAIVHVEVGLPLTLRLENQRCGGQLVAILEQAADELPALRALDLSRARWPADALPRALAILGPRARNLQRLTLSASRGQLIGRPDLAAGELDDAQVSAGLLAFAGLRHLRELQLFGLQVSPHNVGVLKACAIALPSLVRLDFPGHDLEAGAEPQAEAAERIFEDLRRIRGILALHNRLESAQAVGVTDFERNRDEQIAASATDLADRHRAHCFFHQALSDTCAEEAGKANGRPPPRSRRPAWGWAQVGAATAEPHGPALARCQPPYYLERLFSSEAARPSATLAPRRPAAVVADP